jgi:glycosyltransferase involved in cell wall biosynthesis
MLRIAVIEPSGLLYGSEYCLLDILEGLPGSDFDWTIILPKGGGFDAILQERGYQCHFLLTRFLHKVSRARKIIPYFQLYRFLQKNRPDVIYLNQAGLLRVTNTIATRLRIPVVCQVQTLEDAAYVSRHCSQSAVVQSFICNSQFIGDMLNVDERKKSILYQGILTSQPRPQTVSRLASKYDRFTVGILGRIAESKGHFLFVQAARQLVAESETIRFVVIGDGIDRDTTTRFQKAVDDAGLTPFFEMRGYCKDISTELNRIDLLAIPSLAEPLGRVLFDAARFAVPVVVSDEGGLGEISEMYSIGVQFKSRDADSLASAIREVRTEYATVCNDFFMATERLHRGLNHERYLNIIASILKKASKWQNSSDRWFGETA